MWSDRYFRVSFLKKIEEEEYRRKEDLCGCSEPWLLTRYRPYMDCFYLLDTWSNEHSPRQSHTVINPLKDERQKNILRPETVGQEKLQVSSMLRMPSIQEFCAWRHVIVVFLFHLIAGKYPVIDGNLIDIEMRLPRNR